MLCLEDGVSITDEDVHPTWLRTVYRRHHTITQPPNKVILPVCARCNSSMGATFEDPAAPLWKQIMWGQPRPLEEQDRVVLIRWLVKTDALYALVRLQAPRTGYYLPSERAQARLRGLVQTMMETPGVPDGVFVRIGLSSATAAKPSIPRPFRPTSVSYHIADDWIDSINSVGMIVTHTVVLADRSGRLDEYSSGLAGDDRFTILTASGTPWPPRRGLESDGARQMMLAHGHDPRNRIGAGWRLLVGPESGWLRPEPHA